MSDHVIETRGLSNYFGRKCAVDQVTFPVPQGNVVALLGRNGSGKTTFIRMLLGLTSAARGTASLLGADSASTHRPSATASGTWPKAIPSTAG